MRCLEERASLTTSLSSLWLYPLYNTAVNEYEHENVNVRELYMLGTVMLVH